MDPLSRLADVPWDALDGLQREAVRGVALALSGAPAERVIDRLLRDLRTLRAAQRAALVEAIFGVALWRRRLGHHAGVEPAPERASALLFALLRDLAGLPEARAAQLSGLEPPLPPRIDPPAALALRWSFPDWICDSLVRDLGAEAGDLCAALDVPGPVFLRANTLRTDRDALQARLLGEGVRTEPTAHSPLGLRVVGPRPNVLGLPAWREGLFEVQDEGSQLVGLLAQVRPGESVLDYCAGAGGKTLLLAGALQRRGELHAHDVDGERLSRLQQRARRAGVDGLQVHREPPPRELRCDAVLVDAPCSELGTLRRGPDVRFRLSRDDAAALPSLQGALLAAAAQHVRPGGRLVYATCTLRREENEGVVRAFLASHPPFALRRPDAPGVSSSLLRGEFFMALPHRHGTDGFFAAVLARA